MNRTPNDRSKWGSGPWDGEPDHVEWRVDGFPCMAHRNSRGAWCGYVAVPPGHWAYQMNYNRVDADVHGGLTYAGHCQGELCHVQAPGEPSNVWWLGFDTAHGCDAPPVMTSLGLDHGGEYRDLAYIKDQVAKLVEQLRGEPNLRPDYNW